MKRSFGLLAMGLLTAFGFVSAAFAQVVTQLPVQPNSYTYPAAVNNAGLVLGNAYDKTTFKSKALVWQDSQIALLPGFDESYAYAVNDSGVIVGTAISTTDNFYLPIVWENGAVVKLPTLGLGGQARDINFAGEIVGQVETLAGTAPAVWRNRQLTVLPSASVGGGIATTIDDSGVIAGISYEAGGYLPTQWNASGVSVLPVSFGAAYAGSLNVNKSGGGQTIGYVVEQRTLADGTVSPITLAVAWDANGYRVLQSLRDGDGSVAYDVNNPGVIAGFSGTSNGDIAALWAPEGPSALPYDPLLSARAVALNDTGMIIGYDNTDRGNPIPLVWNVASAVSTQMPNLLSVANTPVTLMATVSLATTKLANRRVTFRANGVAMGSANTDAKGVARFFYRVPSKPGKSIAITASLDNRSFVKRAIEIKHYAATSAVSGAYNPATGTLNLVGTLRGHFANQSLAGKPMAFTVDGREVARTVTDARGVARVVVRTTLPTGMRRIEARFNGDASTLASIARSSLQVRR